LDDKRSDRRPLSATATNTQPFGLGYANCWSVGPEAQKTRNFKSCEASTSIGHPIELNDPNLFAVKSRCIDIRMAVERSVTKTIQMDADTRFDVRID
jgi:hypothetical protein